MLIKMFCSVTLVIFPCAAYQRAISVSVLLPNRHCFFFFFFWELNKIAKRPRQFGVLCIWFQRTLLWCWQVRETYRCFSLEATITHPSVWKNNNKKNSRHFFPLQIKKNFWSFWFRLSSLAFLVAVCWSVSLTLPHLVSSSDVWSRCVGSRVGDAAHIISLPEQKAQPLHPSADLSKYFFPLFFSLLGCWFQK